MASRRRQSRIVVMQTLFEMQARGVPPEETLERNIRDLGGSEMVDDEFCHGLSKGVLGKWEEIRAKIQEFAPQWPLERMDPVTRSILMIGAYEILFGNDAPPAVVMNEAIEVAKEFGTEESGKFVNGVLNALAHGTKK